MSLLSRSALWRGRTFSEVLLLFLRRLGRLPTVLRPKERLSVIVMLIAITTSAVFLYVGYGGARPAYGGTFTEGFVGQPRFINPILANSDIDSSITQLIYSGLTKIDANGLPKPDLADHWEVGDGGKKYTFFLRQDALWHDGQKVTAQDVIATLNLIKDPATNSPYYDTWKDITVDSPNEGTVIFHLQDPLATFPWLTSIGLLSSHIDKHNLSTTFVGTGPYRYSKVRMRSGAIESLVLVRNARWYGPHAPYIDAVELWFYADDTELSRAILGQKILAAMGDYGGANHLNLHTLPLSQLPVVFFNSQSKILADGSLRKKIIQSEDHFASPVNINLVADTRLIHNSQFETLLQKWRARNISVTVSEQSLDQIKKTILPGRGYDAILVSIEDGPQVDRYAYWHSSQADGAGLNFARLKNSDLDKLVTDQRKSLTLDERTALLQKIDLVVTDQAVRIPLTQVTFNYSISKSVHPTFPERTIDVSDRFLQFDQWYIKTRR